MKFLSIAALILAIAACGPGSNSNPNIPLSTVVVDPGVKPTTPEVPGINGGPPRPVTSLSDQNGSQIDFVQNELIVIGEKPAVDTLVARWQGQILDSIALSGLDPAESRSVFLIQVNATLADTSQLAADLKQIAPNVRSDLKAGNQDGLNLLAVQAKEAVAGAVLTPNWVWQPGTIEFGPVNEAANGDSDAGNGMNYAADAYTWQYMREGGPQNIGVTRAWTALSLANKLGNRVPIAILDGGFQTNTDLPGGTINIGGMDLMNPSNCTGGAACPWHGTGTSLTAFGQTDNGFGVAGVAGPVATRILVHGKFDAFSAMAQVIAMALVPSIRPRIVNMSFSGNYPAVAAAAAAGPLNLLTLAVRKANILVVAAAGNDNLNLSEEDCFIVCWAKRSFYPCELDNVLCVGGIARNNRTRASFSNYRGKVDIYGPGTVWGPENNVGSGKMRLINGTSVASPFVAGVAGLILAANPSLHANDVERILLETAHTNNGDGVVGRVVNAAAAVQRALGNAAPAIRLRANPVEVGLRQQTFLYSKSAQPAPNVLFSVYDLDLEQDASNVSVRITSDRDAIGLSSTHTFQTPGTRTLTITATDNGGLSSQAFLQVNVVNTPPNITNITAPDSVGLAEGWAPITPVIATDVNETSGVLDCSRVRWSVQGSDILQNTSGCDNFVIFSEQGNRSVTITATDPEGAVGTRVLNVNVGPRPAQIRPSVSGFVVQDVKGKVLQDFTTIDAFRSSQCPLKATATLYNPDNAPANLSWTLDDGTNLRSDALTYQDGGKQVEVNCGGLDAKRYFLQLFLVTNVPSTSKKKFTFDMQPIPPK